MRTDNQPPQPSFLMGCLALLGLLLGLILLLPGLCVLYLAASSLREGRFTGDAGGLFVLGAIPVALGLLLILAIIRWWR